jgi:hypothetical protein
MYCTYLCFLTVGWLGESVNAEVVMRFAAQKHILPVDGNG